MPCHVLGFERSLGIYWAGEKHLPKKHVWQDPEGWGVPARAALRCEPWEHPNSPAAGPAPSAVRVLQAGGSISPGWRLHLPCLPRKWPGHQRQPNAQPQESFEEKGIASG